MLPGMKGKDYEERLRKLNLPSMTYRRLRGDMIETLKILNNIYDSKVTKGIFKIHEAEFAERITRGHSTKLVKIRSRLDNRKHYLSNRVMKASNNLPSDLVSAETVKQLEIGLDKFCQKPRSHI